MTNIEEIEQRISALEEKTDAVIAIINDLIELIYEPRFVKKLDKLAGYGKANQSE